MPNPDHPDWEFIPAVHFKKGRVVPVSGGVDHYTGGGSGRSVANWVAGLSVYNGKPVPPASVCGHIVTCRDGHVIQQVLFRDTAYHAGTSPGRGDLWAGAEPPRNVNDFTVGIENSNYGWLLKSGGVFYIPIRKSSGWVAGRRYPSNLPAPVRAVDHLGEERWWEPYTDEVVEANVGVKRVLLELGLVTSRGQWCGHSDVSPNRKFDPGPLWPMRYTLDQVYGSLVPIEPYMVQGGYDPIESDADAQDLSSREDQSLIGDDTGMCLIGGDE